MVRSIRQSFEELRQRKEIGLVPFLPAGYPDLETTAACLLACDAAGAAVIEVGFPFSDPIADGPTIQEAFTEALAHKIKVKEVFAAVKSVRGKISAPLAAMVSFSIVYRYGLGRFLADAESAGFEGVILPDLPPPEAEGVAGQIQAAGMQSILLIAPTTAPARQREIARLCGGFVYYLSVSGITGERDQLPAGLPMAVRAIKGMTDLPVCVGFGIHRPGQVAELAKVADGAIVGTAIVRRMKERRGDGAEGIAKVVGEYVRSLKPGEGGL
jgi:tryptophan synthase alpha chain